MSEVLSVQFIYCSSTHISTLLLAEGKFNMNVFVNWRIIDDVITWRTTMAN